MPARSNVVPFPDPADDADPDPRPMIRIKGGNLPAEVDAAEAALIAGNSGIYQRGVLLARTGVVSVEISNDRKATGRHVLPVDEHALREAMMRAARWQKYDGRAKEYRDISAPMDAVKAFEARAGAWKLPVLTGLISAPTLRPDGSILSAPGYDPATGLIFDPCGETFPPIRDQPTKEHARAALDALKALVGTFPFVTPADQSVVLSCLLTAAKRRSLRTAPMHAFSAPAAGTGKSKLADIASVIATGREAGVIAQSSNPGEFEKRLGSMFLASEPVIAIDNCEHALGGEYLCQALTQPRIRARILGASKIPEVLANSVITATGNNLALAGDMNRRALLCSLDAQCERPELRTFDNDPVEDAKASRPRLVAAALTILRAYHVAGRPRMANPLGSFTEWSRWVRDALLWLGEADPVSTMENTRKLDPELEVLTAVIGNWNRAFGTDRTTVKAALATANATTPQPYSGKSVLANPDLHDALLAVAGRGGALNNRALGKWLGQYRNRIVGGFRLTQDGVTDGSASWRLEAVPKPD